MASFVFALTPLIPPGFLQRSPATLQLDSIGPLVRLVSLGGRAGSPVYPEKELIQMLQYKAAYAEIFSIVTPKPASDSTFSESREEQGIFSHDIILESPGYIERRAANCVVSIVVHVAVAALLVLLSFLSPVAMRLQPWTRTMLVMPLMRAKAPFAIRRRLIDPANTIFSSLKFSPPLLFNPDRAADFSGLPPDLDASESFDPALGNVLSAAAKTSADLLLPPLPADNFRLVHMGGEVKSSRPLGRLVLVYPELARAAHVFGKVVIRAIIDRSGRVVDARAISGPFLLYAAAVDAVSKERFVPVLLNGEPTKCDLTVEVNFALNRSGY